VTPSELEDFLDNMADENDRHSGVAAAAPAAAPAPAAENNKYCTPSCRISGAAHPPPGLASRRCNLTSAALQLSACALAY